MTDKFSMKFAPLLRQLNTRAHRAVVGQFGFRNEALNRYLHSVLSSDPGLPGSLVADPVFEATFPYKACKHKLEDLSGKLLHPDLVRGLENPPKKYEEDYKFKSDIVPYEHQLSAWQSLLAEQWKSTLISSGTGSGKTECFLFPILDDLARERDVCGGKIEGVRALFLYPLNALIKSQRDRLAAWTAVFGSDVRFCLYNGETPNTVPQRKENEEPQEVKSRKGLRASPPPILVTNATMLEYMLVRKDDQPILDASQGKLRWIILDEAHTYVGSQAGELALLLRRVMIAFGVSRENVRFVATSATIGGESAGANEELRDFLADMAGVDRSQVTVIKGCREVPSLNSEPSSQNVIYQQGDETIAWPVLLDNLGAQQIRNLVSKSPQTLSAIHQRAQVVWPNITRDQTLEFLDTLANTADKQGQSFLPLRGHIFEKTFGGLWACANRNCGGRHDDLADDSWRFGALYFHQQDFCNCCDAPVYELTSCGSCGTEYLEAEYALGEGNAELRPVRNRTNIDEFQLDIDRDDDEDSGPTVANRRLLAPFADLKTDDLNFNAWELLDPGKGDLSVFMLSPSRQDGQEYLQCAHCKDKESSRKKLFVPKRLGAPFFLGDILPTVLESCPPATGEGKSGPSQGRRLLTFTDSRQGTARIAARLQQDTDRNYIRSIVYHSVAPIPGGEQADDATLAASLRKVQDLEAGYEKNRDDVVLGPVLHSALEKLKEQYANASSPPTVALSLPWSQVVEQLSKDKDISSTMREMFGEVTGKRLSKSDFAAFCLYREFARRPKRGAQSELLGLVRLTYPKIEKIAAAPGHWQTRGGTLQDWKDFLTLIIDYFLRGNSIIAIPDEFQRWMGAKVYFKFVLSPHSDSSRGARIQSWPRCHRGKRIRNRLINLVMSVFKLSPEAEEDCRAMDLIMDEAWAGISPLMVQYPDGFQFNMAEETEFATVEKAWCCPYTRKIVPVTFKGYSPYAVIDQTHPLESCSELKMPVLPARYWEGRLGKAPRPDVWLENDESVKALRDKWVWPNRSDRAAAMESWFAVGEHSAQQSTGRLDQLEKDFKAGKVNVLSCSTTMEMGVDIGGMSAVAMNNVPPSQANYLQRAGRAGRRQEAASLAVTLCKQTSHGMEVFNNPLWPFDSSALTVPKVPFDSRPIVLRHVNALLLSEWLRRFKEDVPKLNCGWLFEDVSVSDLERYQQFIIWAETLHVSDEQSINGAIRNLVRQTVLSNVSLQELVFSTLESLKRISDRWHRELKVLLDQRAAFLKLDKEAENSPPIRAIDRQLMLSRKEYLLKELTTSGFLPGHGFPSGIVPLITSTMQDFQKSKANNEDSTREDEQSIKRGAPSRPRSVAIREFAPGADLVMDGAVYQSSGITLNWHIPATLEAPPEDLPLRWSWFCKSCGAGGASKVMPVHCTSCQSNALTLNQMVEPNGFAVALNYEPHNDVNTPVYLPYKIPRVNIADAEMRRFANAALGQYRYSDYGTILSYNTGPSECGYAICLYCGRAEAQSRAGEIPTNMISPPHKRLRGGRENDLELHCPGNDSNWAIKPDIWLAGEDITSVIELRLREPVTEKPIATKEAAWSVAYALRYGLVRKLGINAQEVSVTVQEVDDPILGRIWAIYLYDTATSGAGYVSQLPEEIALIVHKALELLNCHANCDSACNSCLLDWDSQHQGELLDRHQAIAFLQSWQQNMGLPTELAGIGTNVTAVMSSMAESLKLACYRDKPTCITLFVSEEAEKWGLIQWPLLTEVQRWVDDNLKVRVLAPKGTYIKLLAAQKRTLAAMFELAGGQLELGELNSMNSIGGDISLLALMESNAPRYWAASNPQLLPGEGWGRCEDVLVSGLLHIDLPFEPIVLDDFLPAITEVQGARPIKLKRECDGKLSKFGQDFWQAIAEQAGFELPDCNIKEIYYRDRYLVSPLHVSLLYRLLGHLQPFLCKDTTVEILTAEFDRHHRYDNSYAVNQNWGRQMDRDQVVRGVIEGLTGGYVGLTAKPKKEVDHSRELSITWQDGISMKLYLDEGVGCWRINGMQSFEFGGSVSHQIKDVAGLQGYVTMAQPRLGTNMFLLRS